LDLVFDDGKRCHRMGHGSDMQEAFKAFDIAVSDSPIQESDCGRGIKLLLRTAVRLTGERYEV
jgi:hypothetical protein